MGRDYSWRASVQSSSDGSLRLVRNCKQRSNRLYLPDAAEMLLFWLTYSRQYAQIPFQTILRTNTRGSLRSDLTEETRWLCRSFQSLPTLAQPAGPPSPDSGAHRSSLAVRGCSRHFPAVNNPPVRHNSRRRWVRVRSRSACCCRYPHRAMRASPRSRCANAAELALAEFQNRTSSFSSRMTTVRRRARSKAHSRPVDEGAESFSEPLVRVVGSGCRASRAQSRHLDDRVLDRLERRRPRRLSVEFPAGVRCQPHRRLRRRYRQAILRGVPAGDAYGNVGGSRVQAGGRAQGWPRRRV